MSLATIRSGLAARLGTISGMRVHAFDVDTVNPPAAIVPPPETIRYDQAMGKPGLSQYDFKVRVYFSKADARNAQDKLCDALEPAGATSVKAAIEGDRNPGVGCLFAAGVPAADDLVCSAVENTGVYEVGNTLYVGAEFAVTVYARS